MKLIRQSLTLLLGGVTLLLGVPALLGCLRLNASAAAPSKSLTILFTHDTHDHFLPMPAEEGGEYGGYTRLATLLKAQRKTPATLEDGGSRQFPTVTLDAGDFSMGSLFQTIYRTDAPELRALGAMGYDATTLGNHEFDYRQGGLADMLNAAKRSGQTLPALVQANYTVPKDVEGGRPLTQALERYPVTDYTVIERDGLRVAVFGLMGEDADACAPMSGMVYEPIVDAAKRVVAEIEERERADFIVCLSHSGTDGKGKGEDYDLAKAVPGIDIILSGHTHSTLEEPIRVGNTLLVSCGEYTQNLGRITISKNVDAKGALSVLEYKLLPVDETIPDDPTLSAFATDARKKVDEDYLSDYGFTFEQVLAKSPFAFTPISQFGAVQEEDPLGSLIADSYRYAVERAEGAEHIPVDFAVVASGVIRGSFAQGDITVSDAFQVSSLGSGGDGTPGYPLISVYITGRELRDVFEVDASVTPLMSAAQLYPAGMTWSFNPHRMIFNKVTGSAQVLEDGTRVPIEEDRLYRVVTGLYSGQMLGTVNGKSFGILTITPRDETGAPVEHLEERILHSQNGTEIKEWYALASYLQSMGTVDERYAAPEGRKVAAPSWNPIELLKHPNGFTLGALAAAAGALTVLVVLVRRGAGRGRRSGGGHRHYRGKRR